MIKKNDIKVSIIVPVFNVPEIQLKHCIESTMSQSLKEIEIILVDDGSTDMSGTICDEYATKDKRIICIHQKNHGLSATRNIGYRASTGKFITFLDGDDWIEEKTCEDNYNLAEKNSSDIVIFGTMQEFGHYNKSFSYNFSNGEIFVGEKCKMLQCEILNFNGNIATAWGKLIRRTILDMHHIEHNEILKQGSEGIEFNIRLFDFISSAIFTNKIYYHYIYNSNSISAKHDEKNHYLVIQCFEEIKNQISLSSNRKALEQLFYNRFMYIIISTAVTGYFSPVNIENYKTQKKKYSCYLKEPLVVETFKKVNYKKMDKSRMLLICLIKLHYFGIIKLVARLRFLQKHM